MVDLAAVEDLAVAVPVHPIPQEHPAAAAVAVDPLVEGVAAMGRLRPAAAALEARPHMVASIAQMKRTESGSPIATWLALGFRAQP